MPLYDVPLSLKLAKARVYLAPSRRNWSSPTRAAVRVVVPEVAGHAMVVFVELDDFGVWNLDPLPGRAMPARSSNDPQRRL